MTVLSEWNKSDTENLNHRYVSLLLRASGTRNVQIEIIQQTH